MRLIVATRREHWNLKDFESIFEQHNHNSKLIYIKDRISLEHELGVLEELLDPSTAEAEIYQADLVDEC